LALGLRSFSEEEAMTVRKVAVQLTVLMGLCLCLSGASARSSDRRDFWALNNTGKEIREFYVSAHENTNWGQDVLGRATLPSGMGTKIVFSRGVATSCEFDFKLVYSDGTSQVYQKGRDVCTIMAIVYNEDDSIILKVG
jgi:hypothetical protein